MKKARPRLPSLNRAPAAAPPEEGWPAGRDDTASSSQDGPSNGDQESKSKDRLPQIDHERYKIPAEPNSRLDYTIFERRGIRDLVLRRFKNDHETIYAAVKDHDAPEDIYNSLIARANKTLSDAGEMPLSEAVNLFKDEDFEGNPVNTVSFSLAVWKGNIAEKHGHLSPEAAAAGFLVMAEKVFHMLGGDEEKLGFICALCEAWHWLHMEATGEHALAYAGVKAAQGRLRAAPAAKTRKQASEAIVAAEYGAYCQREPRKNRHNASAAASAILAAVNARLTEQPEQRLGTYTEGSLRKVLGTIIKARNNAH